jgi:hypothetical protein
MNHTYAAKTLGGKNRLTERETGGSIVRVLGDGVGDAGREGAVILDVGDLPEHRAADETLGIVVEGEVRAGSATSATVSRLRLSRRTLGACASCCRAVCNPSVAASPIIPSAT